MNDKGLYPRAYSSLNRMTGNSWLTGNPARQLDRPLSSEPSLRHSRLLPTLKRLAWLVLAATMLAGLVTWGFHSRFGLLLLLLLR
ncbi:hypothetical protein GV819_15550 [Pseudomonas sp. Fl5BN2]|uniref:hypothetical protein n=1 Tax=unclassified Pseudomonas TaxID=196821 RepID=UPI001376B2C4|nr:MULTISPECIES: hypothetical protein [unclassified Pseudomonas]NBF03708.1 hypothetical protein [Pseudomonas sp. Fl5BN2]NBF10436.1 hypothetical protein [Pseudomonas sp. Fl4BN1]